MSLPRRFDSKSRIDGLEGTPGIYRKLTEAEVIADYIESKKGDLLFNDNGPSKNVSKEESTENRTVEHTTSVKSSSSITNIEREHQTILQASSPRATSTPISKTTTKQSSTSTHRTTKTTAALQFFKDKYRTKDDDNSIEKQQKDDGNTSSSSSASSDSPKEGKPKRNKSLNVDKSFVPVNDYYQFYQVNNQQPEFLTEEKIQILRKDNEMMIKQHELKMLAAKYHKRADYNPYDQIAYFGPVVLNESGEPHILDNPQFTSGFPLDEEVRTESTNLSTFKPHVQIGNVEKQELDTKPVQLHSLKSSPSSTDSQNENHCKNQRRLMGNVQKKDKKDSLENKDRKMSSSSSSSSENDKENVEKKHDYQTKQRPCSATDSDENTKKASLPVEHSLLNVLDRPSLIADSNGKRKSSSSNSGSDNDETPNEPKNSGKNSKDINVTKLYVVTKDRKDSAGSSSQEDSGHIQDNNKREKTLKRDSIKSNTEDQGQGKRPDSKDFSVAVRQYRRHSSSSNTSNGDNYIEIPSLPADHGEQSDQRQLPLPLPISSSPRGKNSSSSSSSNENSGDNNYIEIPTLPPRLGKKGEPIPLDPNDISITSSDSSFLQNIPTDNTYSEPYEMEPKQLGPNGIGMEKLEAQIITDVSRTPTPPPLPSSNPPPLRKDIPSDYNIEHTIKKIKDSNDTPLPEYEDEVFEAKMTPNYHGIDSQYLENGSVEIRNNKETQLTNDLKQPRIHMDIQQQPDKAKRRHSSHSNSSSDSSSDDGKEKLKTHSKNVLPLAKSKDCNINANGMTGDKQRSPSSDSSSPDTKKKEDKPSPPPRKLKKEEEEHKDVVDTPTQTNDDVDTTDREVQVCEDSLEGKDLKAGDYLDFSISTSESPSAFSTPRGPCNKIRSVSSYSSSSEDENKKPYKIKGLPKQDINHRELFPAKPKEDSPKVGTVLKNDNTPALPLKPTDKSVSSSDSISSENITSYNVNPENESDKDKKLDVSKDKTSEHEVEIKVPKIPKRKDKSQPPEIPKRKTKQTSQEKESKDKNKVGSHSSSSSCSSSDSDSDENKNSKKEKSRKQKTKRSDSGGIRAKIEEFFKRKDKKSKPDKKDREKKKSTTDEECQKEVAKVNNTQPPVSRSPENIYEELIVQKGKNKNLSPSKTSTNNSAETETLTVDLPSFKGEVDLKNHSGQNIDLPSIKGGADIGKPSVGLPNIDLHSCNADIGKPSLPSVNLPSIKGDLDIGSLPSVNLPSIKGNVDAGKPSLPGVDLPGCNVDIGSPSLPSVNLPGVKDDVDVGKASLPGVDLPSCNVNIGKPSLPSMNLPSVKGNVDIRKPSLPSVNLPSVKGNVNIGKPSLPSVNLPSVKGNVDIGEPSLPCANLPSVRGDVDKCRPFASGVDLPSCDVDIGRPLPDVNLSSSGDKPCIPNVEIPKLNGDIGIGIPLVPTGNGDVCFEKPNSKIDSPKVDCDVKLTKPSIPEVNVTREEQPISSNAKYSIPPIDLSGFTDDNNSPIHKTIVSVPGNAVHTTSGEPQKPSRKARSHKNNKDDDGTKREKGSRKKDKGRRKRSVSSSASLSSSSSSSSSHIIDTSHDNSIIIEQSQNHTPEKQKITDNIQAAVSSPLTITPSVTVKSPSKDIYATPNKLKSEHLDVGIPESPSEGNHFVVVAIDFGTTFSGYAFSFVRDPENILMMRKWEGGDPGVINQKTPTIILLEPHGKFHSFGFTARDAYNDLDPKDAASWLYFDKFKMVLHHQSELTKDTMIAASNGMMFPALNIFAYALKFLKDHALQELSDQSGFEIVNEDIRWVITVPAIWKAPAKQFMRQAAYSASLVSLDSPDKLLIALEPEAASIYCRKLKMHQLIPEYPIQRPLQSPKHARPEQIDTSDACNIDAEKIPTEYSFPLQLSPNQTLDSSMRGTRYMVVDCGGGTVDITVHELNLDGKLVELHKATGGPYGAVGVDIEFEKLLCCIFGKEFIINYKQRYPVGWVNLMANFESRKRSANPTKPSSSNISLPFSFIDYHKKHRGRQVESMVKKHGDKDVRWSAQGMLRLSPEAMKLLFIPTIDKIKQAIGDVINHPNARRLKYMFLVGGFAESPIVQHEIRKEFDSNKKHIVKVLIPQAVSLAILKGAVMYGLDPTVVNVRRSRLTYGIGVLNRFDTEKHPQSKLVTRDDKEWCTDVFEKFVVTDEPVALGDVVLKSYTPAVSGQNKSIINIYCSEDENVQFITDIGVMKCGTLTLDLSENDIDVLPYRREIQILMCFGDTEIKVSAQDISTGQVVRSTIDFLNK